MKIILGERTSAYLSKRLNAEIKDIYLEEDSIDIQEELTRFIEELILNRTWTTVRCPYDYDDTNKRLFIHKHDDIFDSVDHELKYKEILERRIEQLKEVDENE